MSKSHARRFVQSAWALLSFQLVASIGAVAVTGVAAMHVQQLAARLEAGGPESAVEAAVETPAGALPSEAPPTEAPSAAAAAPGEAAPATETAVAQAPIVVAPCERTRSGVRVQANVEWCDTGIQVQRGQRILFVAQGDWSAGERLGSGPGGFDRREANTLSAEAPRGALIGRAGGHVFTIGASNDIQIQDNGPLHLSMNDVAGGFGDNRGAVDVFLQFPTP